MFRRQRSVPPPTIVSAPPPTDRVTSVIGAGVFLKGVLSGTGGVRIEGAFEGEIALRGLLVVGETGRVTCERLRANTVIVAGAVRGDITAEKLDIRRTGRVWGNVVTVAMSTEEGAFLRGQVRMEERVDLGLAAAEAAQSAAQFVPEPAASSEQSPAVVDLGPTQPASTAAPGTELSPVVARQPDTAALDAAASNADASDTAASEAAASEAAEIGPTRPGQAKPSRPEPPPQNDGETQPVSKHPAEPDKKPEEVPRPRAMFRRTKS